MSIVNTHFQLSPKSHITHNNFVMGVDEIAAQHDYWVTSIGTK